MSKAKIRRARLGKGGPRAFSAVLFTERLFTTISEPGTGYNLLEGGTSNAWESFILGVDCVFIKGLSLTNSWLSAYQSLMK